jgi:hypothetical protein
MYVAHQCCGVLWGAAGWVPPCSVWVRACGCLQLSELCGWGAVMWRLGWLWRLTFQVVPVDACSCQSYVAGVL